MPSLILWYDFEIPNCSFRFGSLLAVFSFLLRPNVQHVPFLIVNQLGAIEEEGLPSAVGGAADPVVARKHYESACELGSPQAQWSLGNLYLFGRGVQKDAVKAVELFQV
jgi:hypothetical protein